MKTEIKSQIDSLMYTLKHLERENEIYNRVYNTLSNGNKIVISALGKNVPIAEKFVGTMVSLGLKASFMHTNSAVHGDMGLVNNNDLVILLSKSGNTLETEYLAKHLLKNSVDFICLSFGDKSSLLYKIKPKDFYSFKLKTEGDLWNLIPNNSSVTFLVILQAIVMKLIKIFKIDSRILKRNHPGGAIGNQINK
jgi:D-arabinose 5-phosphate isomerase GutQ